MMDGRKFLSIVLFLSLSAFAGCGSSSNSTGTTSEAAAEGVWVGIYTNTAGLQFPSITLITSTGMTGIDFGNGVFFIGSTTMSNNQLLIIGNESVLSSALVTLGTSVLPQQRMHASVLNGTYVLNTGDRIDCSYDPVYQKDSSLDKLTATWSGQNVFSGQGVVQDWTISIAQDGTFNGSAGNFALTGTVNPIDSNKNEYLVSMKVSDPSANHTINGNYSGIATLLDTNGIDDTLLMFFEGDQQFKVIGKLELYRN
jgi:hypothetical protein